MNWAAIAWDIDRKRCQAFRIGLAPELPAAQRGCLLQNRRERHSYRGIIDQRAAGSSQCQRRTADRIAAGRLQIGQVRLLLDHDFLRASHVRRAQRTYRDIVRRTGHHRAAERPVVTVGSG